MDLVGGLTVTVDAHPSVTRARIEDALMREGWLTDTLIREGDDGRWTLALHVPMSAITGDGVPRLDAAGTLRSLADALDVADGRVVE